MNASIKTHVVTMRKRVTASQTLTATACLHQIDAQSPYFSVTGTLTDSRVRGADKVTACGMLHAEIAEHFPALRPVMALHLADIDGTPMHAVENGWHHAQGTQNGSALYLSELLRIDLDMAHCVMANIKAGQTSKACFTVWCDSMRPRWQREAREAIALLDRMA